ncbi:hypothetical protein OWR28_19925 [Chryseobacterium sp. 1B4]
MKDSEDVRLFNELRKKVNKRVEAISENRDIYIQVKAVILPLVYIGLYFLAVLNAEKHWIYILSFVLMGISLVLIYLNLIHEAAHNNIYKSKRLNGLVLHIFDFIGANSYIWKKTYCKPPCLPKCRWMGYGYRTERIAPDRSMDQGKRDSEVSA